MEREMTVQRRQFGQTPLQISLLGLGCMRFPQTADKKIDMEKAGEIVDYAYSHGVNYFDTAYVYNGGESEEVIGKLLQKYDRSSYYLADKMPMWQIEKSGDLEEIFNTSLRRLQTDYIDFYLIHALDEEKFEKSLRLGVYDFICKKKAEGKVRHIGFSFHDSPKVLRRILDAYPVEFAQIQLNYLDWELQDAKAQYEMIAQQGIPCVIMEPVRGGALADLGETANGILKQARPDRSIASWAIRYASALPNVLTVLSGMSTLGQVEDNVQTLSQAEPLSPTETQALAQATDAYRKKDTVPCTGCRYCMDCPSGVDIPLMFHLYNDYAFHQDRNAFLEGYDKAGDRQAANCISCGVCAEHCPQSISIPEKMEMIRELVQKLRG